jgi:hypothetical protein
VVQDCQVYLSLNLQRLLDLPCMVIQPDLDLFPDLRYSGKVHNLLAHLTLCLQVVYDLRAGLPAIEVDLVSAHVEKVHRSEGVHEVLV